MNLIHRKTCRVCGNCMLTPVIDLGEMYLQGAFVKEGQPMPSLRKAPTQLVRCDTSANENACGLLQMAYSVPPEILYSSYWYRSGTNDTMRNHLSSIAVAAVAMHGDAHYVLDIGCNDGTLLSFYPEDWTLVGIDPSGTPYHPRENLKVHKSLYPHPSLPEGEHDIITSIAMFYDLEDPVAFARQIWKDLAVGGIWVMECSYMPTMLERNAYDTICHEHLEYYSFAVIERICKQAKLKVVRAELNESNGGSIRCFITHEQSIKYENTEWQVGLQKLRMQEWDQRLDTDEPYREFARRIFDERNALLTTLALLHSQGKKIHVLGASTKGNTILQYSRLEMDTIDACSDRNFEKDGAFTLGTNFPIISEEKSREMKPDVYLVLPYHFAKEIIEREQEFLKRGGIMVFPLPKVTTFMQ